jgi:hypothetical protein
MCWAMRTRPSRCGFTPPGAKPDVGPLQADNIPSLLITFATPATKISGHPPRSSSDDIRPSIMSWSRGKWRSIKCGGNLSDGIVAPPRVGHSQAVAIDPSKDALSYLTICVVTDGTQGLDCLV